MSTNKWLLALPLLVMACSGAGELEESSAGESASTAGSYTLATCKSGSGQESFDTLKLVARTDGQRVVSISSAATDYRGAFSFDVSSIGSLPTRGGGALQRIISGTGTVAGNGSGRDRTIRQITAIILDPEAKRVGLTWARTDGDGQSYDNCSFSNLSLLSPSAAPSTPPTIAACKSSAEAPESYETLKLTATMNGDRVASISSAPTDYRGALSFNVTSITTLPPRGGGALQRILYGTGTLTGGPRDSSVRQINSIILDPQSRRVFLGWARTESDGQSFDNCTFGDLGQIAAQQ